MTAFISTSEMYGGVKKRETVSVAELNTYVPESPSQLCFIRYRVAMLVVAREDSAVFVAFDASMTKLTNVMAVEVANQWWTCNPPEVVDETTLPAEAVQPTSNTDQLERIIGGNVDDPHGSPPGNPSKKAWNV
ncbi:hypothetical protein HID58_042351 [Brassica napus]|uniref:Uncharacterized protein n=1 Tax=Brassica napus TaxID=3708 RepID=A0ABQ8BDP0_BRANA|nr:hypothetical protein HID58_042351 [Brassica napus]